MTSSWWGRNCIWPHNTCSWILHNEACDITYYTVESHCNDVIMGPIASQITSLMIVYSIVYSDADQRKHQSSSSLAFVRGIHRGPVDKFPNISIWWRHHDNPFQFSGCYAQFNQQILFMLDLHCTCRKPPKTNIKILRKISNKLNHCQLNSLEKSI